MIVVRRLNEREIKKITPRKKQCVRAHDIRPEESSKESTADGVKKKWLHVMFSDDKTL